MTHTIDTSQMSHVLKKMYVKYRFDTMKQSGKKMKGGKAFPIPMTSIYNTSSLDLKPFEYPQVQSSGRAPFSNFST